MTDPLVEALRQVIHDATLYGSVTAHYPEMAANAVAAFLQTPEGRALVNGGTWEQVGWGQPDTAKDEGYEFLHAGPNDVLAPADAFVNFEPVFVFVPTEKEPNDGD